MLEKVMDGIEMSSNVLEAVNKAEALIDCLLTDGIYSWSEGYYEKEGWLDVQTRHDQTGLMLAIVRDYLRDAADRINKFSDQLESSFE